MRSAEFNEHPSVKLLVSEAGIAGSPAEVIRAKARALVAHSRELGWTGPPFDMRILASLCGFHVKRGPVPVGQAALLVSGNSPTIVVADDQARTRTRFSIAHEIAHTLFPDVWERADPAGWRYRLEAQSPVEQLCQLAAAEFLLPLDEFVAAVGSDPFWADVADLTSMFDASLESVIRRLGAVLSEEFLGLKVTMGLKPSESIPTSQFELIPTPPPVEKLRGVYAFGTHDGGRFFPPDKSIPDDSCAYRLIDAEGKAEARELSEDWSDCFGWPSSQVRAFRDYDGLLLLVRRYQGADDSGSRA